MIALRGLAFLGSIVLTAGVLPTEAPAQIPCVVGFVRDANGSPVVDADLDFDDAATGQRIPTPGDNTDNSGFYRVCVLPGTYHISYAPPPLTHLLGKQYFNVVLILGQNLEQDVTLGVGRVISGTVRDPQGNPVAGVDLDADSLSTGGRVYTPNDNSDSTGVYWIVVPPQAYRIRFQPPANTRWRGLELDSVSAFADTTIDVTLEQGFLLSGRVTDTAAQGLIDITVDLRDQATGEKVFVANNKTDSSGHYSVAVPAGMFELRYEPPAGSRLVAVAIDSFSIAGDMVQNQVLESGFLVTSSVTDSSGSPLRNADLDFIREATGERIFTPNDKTDSSGIAIASLLADVYTVRVDPPPGTIFDRLTVTGMPISRDTTLHFALREVPRVNLTGRVVNASGIGLPDVTVDFVDTLTGSKVYVADNSTGADGSFGIAVPIGTFHALFSPPQGSRYVGIMLRFVTMNQDTVWSDVVLDTGLIFSAYVYDFDANPVANVDFDFISRSSGAEVVTPFDNTDSLGFARMAVPADTYTIILTPPQGVSGLATIDSFLVATDTSHIFFLSRGSNSLPAKFVLRQNFPNPFNQATTISYFLFESSAARLSIYNGLGQRVIFLDLGHHNAGPHSFVWNANTSSGEQLASGTYFYRLDTDFGSDIHKMLLLR